MSDAERLVERVAQATGVGTAAARAVWLREASEGLDSDLLGRCRERLVEFATRGKQSRDADLWPNTVKPVTAASQLLMWDDVPTSASGSPLLDLGQIVSFSVDGDERTGTLVRATADSVTVNVHGTLHVCSPAEVRCTR